MKLDELHLDSIDDILVLPEIQEILDMRRRKEILRFHKYKVWKGTDNKWYTYIPDNKGGRKLKKRNAKSDLEDMLIEFYENEYKESMGTFEKMFDKYSEFQRQEVGVSGNTYYKYKKDYQRFFADTEFSKKPMDEIDSEEIRAFVISKTKELELNKKALKALIGYLKSVFFYARAKHIITEDPMSYLKTKYFFQFASSDEMNVESRTLSSTEMKLLMSKVDESIKSNPSFMPNYAVKLAAYSGMRVGELSALMWDCVSDSSIKIDKAEIHDRSDGHYEITKTKNGKTRYIPVTKEIRELLYDIRAQQNRCGIVSGYVFAKKDGTNIHARTISDTAANRSKQVGIGNKSIHALRRTLNSNMKTSGVPTVVAASILGHTEAVNEMNYTYDMSSITQKGALLEKVYQQVF